MFQIQANKYIQYAGEKNNTEVLICKQIMENLAYGERIAKVGWSDIGHIREIINHMLCGEFFFKQTVGLDNGIKCRISSLAAKVIKLNLVSKCLE